MFIQSGIKNKNMYTITFKLKVDFISAITVFLKIYNYGFKGDN